MRAGLGVGGGWGLSLTRTGGKGRREHPARGRWDHAHTVIHVIHRDTRAAHTQARWDLAHTDARTAHEQAGLTCSAEMSSTSWRAFSMPSLVPVILI